MGSGVPAKLIIHDSSRKGGVGRCGRSTEHKICFLQYKIWINRHSNICASYNGIVQKFCCKMSFTDVLAMIGGIIVVFYLLKLFWTCWRGLQQYVLSEIWKVDLRTYGQWAGKIKENIYTIYFVVCFCRKTKCKQC